MSEFLVTSSAVKWEEGWARDYEASLGSWWPGSSPLSAAHFLCESQQPAGFLDIYADVGLFTSVWRILKIWQF